MYEQGIMGRGCVETVASLAFCANIEPELFGDLGRLLLSLRNIIDGRGNGAYQEALASLGTLWNQSNDPNRMWSGVHKRHIMERQLWRLQDFRDGGGFGYWVELFFLMNSQILQIQLPAMRSVASGRAGLRGMRAVVCGSAAISDASVSKC
ncbi:hypothetical protein EDB83DRAFT_2453728 [Lactarius deliciosus]|nr:hypothetical protein EDB83DRAFT_2453728 [Lactarius deliciosus]